MSKSMARSAAAPRSSSNVPRAITLSQLARFSMRSTSKQTSEFLRIIRTFNPSAACP